MEEQFYNFIDDEFVTLQELTQELQFADTNSTRKWLSQREIPTEKRGRSITIFRWEIDFALKKQAAKHLMKQYPLRWHKIFEAGCEDINMMKAVFAVYPPPSTISKSTNSIQATRNYIK